MIQAAFQRTVNSAWKREFGALRRKTTVSRSGTSMPATLIENAALQFMPG